LIEEPRKMGSVRRRYRPRLCSLRIYTTRSISSDLDITFITQLGGSADEHISICQWDIDAVGNEGWNNCFWYAMIKYNQTIMDVTVVIFPYEVIFKICHIQNNQFHQQYHKL
jgi:hypothetical protein